MTLMTDRRYNGVTRTCTCACGWLTKKRDARASDSFLTFNTWCAKLRNVRQKATTATSATFVDVCGAYGGHTATKRL